MNSKLYEIFRALQIFALSRPSVMQEFHVPVIYVIDGADHRRILAVAQVIDIQRMTDLPDAVLHI